MTRRSHGAARRRSVWCRPGLLALAWAASLGGAAAAEGAAQEGVQCGAGEIRGVAEADARTAVEVVCERLRERSRGRGVYEISVRSLGRHVVLTASRKDDGTSITVQLEGIEEVAVSAPRVAEALIAHQPLTRTQRVDNLLESETRVPLNKKGSLKFTTGVSTFHTLGHGGSGAGFSFGLTYTSPKVALPVAMRFGLSDRSDAGRDAGFFAISAGARRYFSRTDVSLFAGAGFSMLRLSASDGYDDRALGPGFDGHRLGAAPYFEAGVELLRLHRARLSFAFQADVPTGSIRSPEHVINSWDASRRQSRSMVVPAESRYVVPVTLGVTVAF